MTDLWAGLISENWDKEGTEVPQGFFVSLVISSPTLWATSWCTYRYLSDAIHFPSWIQLWLSFVFPSSVPAYSGNVSRFFMESSYLLPPSVYFSFVFHLCQEFLVHVCWPSAMPAQMSTCWNGPFLRCEKLFLRINQLSLGPVPLRAVSRGIMPRRSLNKPKSAILKSMTVILLFVLLTFLKVVNPTLITTARADLSFHMPVS